jgi:hypothetical protein
MNFFAILAFFPFTQELWQVLTAELSKEPRFSVWVFRCWNNFFPFEERGLDHNQLLSVSTTGDVHMSQDRAVQLPLFNAEAIIGRARPTGRTWFL